MKSLLLCCSILSIAMYAQNSIITPLGPEGGIVTHLTGSPTDDVILAVVRDKGLYRSEDGGSTWQNVTNSIVTSSGVQIYDIVFHPLSSDTILLATSSGLIRSNDKGKTFLSPLTSESPQTSVRYSPANPAVLFGSNFQGVLTSTDGGASWTALKDNIYFGNRYISKIAIHPADTGGSIRLLATAESGDEHVVYLSSNSGKNWRPFNKGLPEGNARRINRVELDSIGIGRTHFRAVMGTADGIYAAQTDFFDTNWTAIKSNLISGIITSSILVYDKYDTTAVENDRHKFSIYFATNPSDYNGIPKPFSARNGLFKIGSKYNSIFTISIVEPPPIKRIFSGLGEIASVFIPYQSNKSKIYLGTSNGIFISTDEGLTWHQSNAGIRHSEIRSVVSIPSLNGSNILLAGIYGGGIFRSTDEGTTWLPSNTGFTSPYVTSLMVNRSDNIVYAGSSYSVHRSVDRGLTWIDLFKVDSSVVLNAMKFTNSENDISIRVSPLKNTLLLMNSNAYGLRFSTNGGGSWTLLNAPSAADSGKIPENIAFDPIDTNTIYFSSDGLYKSTNLGQSWVDLSSNLPKVALYPVSQTTVPLLGLSPTINPRNTDEIYLSTVFKIDQGAPYRLFKTTNGGTSWDSLSEKIPSYDVLFDEYDSKRVISSGPGGIFGTTDGGGQWKKFSDPLSSVKYYLIDGHFDNSNILYAGSNQGAHKIELLDNPKIEIDTLPYRFGSIVIGKDSSRNIPIKNILGTKSLFVTFESLSDTDNFQYAGPKSFEIAAGGQTEITVKFSPNSRGEKGSVMIFHTNDPVKPSVQFTLLGHCYTKFSFSKFVFDFGSVALQKDSLLSLSIPNETQNPITVKYTGNSDTVNFSVVDTAAVVIDTGKTGSIAFRFHPLTAGDKKGELKFTTTDPRFPLVLLQLSGVGIAKNYLTRKIIVDTTFGRFVADSQLVSDYYRILRATLTKAELVTVVQKPLRYVGNNSVIVAQPSSAISAVQRDSLQNFVVSGGTLVLLCDHRGSSSSYLNTFLSDTTWQIKYSTKTGIRFSTTLLVDSVMEQRSLNGVVISNSVGKKKLTERADSIVFFNGTFLNVDTTNISTSVLYAASSDRLYSRDTGTVMNATDGPVATVAMSAVGAGTIIAIADPDLWWNGPTDDTTNAYGIFGGRNLNFALNVFGIIQNVKAELRETIEEKYDFFSIPYTFEDSSITKLFRDLGEHNNYLWRLFGKYSTEKGYQEYPKDFTRILRGEGYWLITKEKKRINLGTTNFSGISEDFTIPVNPGYTMIGNPFPYAVSWKNSFRGDSVESVIWSYNGGVYDSSTTVMEPFRGYWVFNRGKEAKVIRINATPVTKSSIPKVQTEQRILNDGEWIAQFSAVSKSTSDSKTFIGVLRTASDGWDQEDFVKPPTTPTDYLTFSLLNHQERLSADYRSGNPEGHVWDCSISASVPNQSLTLRTQIIGNLPSSFGIYLIDLRSERIFDLKNSPEYQLMMEKNEKTRRMRIIAGTKDFLSRNSDGIPLVPIEYSLSQNYPNPFNPVTTIRYSISNSALVTIKIFNVLGQEVKTLVKNHQRIGEYSTIWDGKDNHGILVASGIYYYQIQANHYRSVKKMTFIK